MKELSMTWEQKLEAARLQWEKEQKMTANKDENLKSKYPYLQVNFSYLQNLIAK